LLIFTDGGERRLGTSHDHNKYPRQATFVMNMTAFPAFGVTALT
jgi:hypothetical protein